MYSRERAPALQASDKTAINDSLSIWSVTLLPNGVRLSCAAELCSSQMEFYHC
jgi:hypothetical protein